MKEVMKRNGGGPPAFPTLRQEIDWLLNGVEPRKPDFGQLYMSEFGGLDDIFRS